ncbi:hypothetical protein HO173_003229 [Letharia columbiana]|uniref:Uncharacterized protein n=1 Tax=Letharia columbiana TaxID=112416 RepID=A0A8H6L7U4_9LECA|nr:uncharacterized protein HO173_003229 [Letharia columbiana]KAF6238723.1 hypothetical protein HO173_003229 [Letharia columbiana]
MDKKFEHVNSTVVLDYEPARFKHRHTLPQPLKVDLHRWMLNNHTKFPEARRIRNLVKNFTCDIHQQKGLEFDPQPGGKRTNGRYKLGYEYILNDEYCGTLRYRPNYLPVSDLLAQFFQSEQLYKYEPQDVRHAIDELKNLLTRLEAEELDSGQGFGCLSTPPATPASKKKTLRSRSANMQLRMTRKRD